jgi:GntR family phosphonate transport system transcriptional regulator
MREIDRASRTPPWQQIAAALRAEIKAGRYGPDDPLPSIGRLVQLWGVNRKTAHKALASLVADGLVEVEPGMGFYVRSAR